MDTATLCLDERSYIVNEGAYCCFPAGQKVGHHLFNHTDTTCSFMTIGENSPHDVCYYPRRGVARIKETGEMLSIMRAT
jgi:uncharacterized cupin superfamily protein